MHALASLRPLPVALCPRPAAWSPRYMERKSAQPPQGALLCLSLSPQHSMGPQQPGLCSPLPQPPDPLNLGWCRCTGEGLTSGLLGLALWQTTVEALGGAERPEMNLNQSLGVTAFGLGAGGWARRRRLEFLPRGITGPLPTCHPWFMVVRHS